MALAESIRYLHLVRDRFPASVANPEVVTKRELFDYTERFLKFLMKNVKGIDGPQVIPMGDHIGLLWVEDCPEPDVLFDVQIREEPGRGPVVQVCEGAVFNLEDSTLLDVARSLNLVKASDDAR